VKGRLGTSADGKESAIKLVAIGTLPSIHDSDPSLEFKWWVHFCCFELNRIIFVAHRSGHPHSATIEVIEGDLAGTSRRFQAPVYIGRAALNTYRFPDDEGLDDVQAVLSLRGDGWWDCESRSYVKPTFVDDQQIGREDRIIRSGSVVRCGKQAFRITYLEPGGQFDGSPVEAVRVGQQEDAARLVRQAIAGFLPKRD